MDAIVGKAYTVTFSFLIDDVYVTPDASSISYTLFDNSGAAVSGSTGVAISDGNVISNAVDILISSGQHTVASGKDFEQRTVELYFSVGGAKHTFKQHYYVTSQLNYRCQPDEVLTLLGLREGELWGDQVDFVRAYFTVASIIGSSTFTTALASGTLSQIHANKAIVAQAALDLITGLELKALRKAGGDLVNFQRFEKVDFGKVKADVAGALSKAIAGVSGSTTIPTLFTVGTNTDAITGV